jgi:hypothetical protein
MPSSAKSVEIRFTPPLLNTESQAKFAALYKELEDELQPKGVIERIYVQDIACITWEVQRLRSCISHIVNQFRLSALKKLLRQLLCRQDFEDSYKRDEAAERLAREWFEDEEAKTQVASLLRQFQMDETDIEAEAFRSSLEELDRLSRMLTNLEFRRDKALHCIVEHRRNSPKQLELVTDRVSNGVPRYRPGQTSD